MKHIQLTILLLLFCDTCFATANSVGVGAGISLPEKNVLTAGLVGHWTFEEGTGTSTLDSSVSGNNGTITGATWVDGIKGKCLSYDGDDYVNMGDPANGSLDFGTSSFSFGCWVNGTYTTAFDGIIYKGATSGPSPGYVLYCNASGYRFSIGNGILTYASSNKTGYNIWQHLFLVADRNLNNMKMYVNGSLYSENTITLWQTGSSTSNNISLQIGRYSSGYYKGRIDNVRIYNRALSEAEIQTLYYLKQ